MNKLRSISKWVVPVVILALPLMSLGATILTPTVAGGGRAVTLVEIENLINGIARFLVVISIVLAAAFIIIGGIMWIIARGDDDMVARAKKTILNGIIGALVVLAVGVILQTISGIVTRSFFSGFTS
ncbi:MAG: hypothetical protein COV31_02925 [Candidatus Yanofskybacteria bacterium CG10_big_fil_rev_8_21_14_0_10_46_23]|uniref:Uncharacterized protein n=1 Tax=Candidatus Yanofskybacteria bacterium CG10_big_fil_rev_8_21_14_0_10_46_23 TaxID=1975098 RepID=A0A2H0R3F4_9BACT|nr:MAG: hypothetical protein COV31_02925 [Candidatus Yanofskybacteria bacterium CG10_big_fil_rev_8_21_14_0_10_46_23]